MKISTIIAFLIIGFSQASAFDFIKTRGIGLGETVVLSNPTASGLLLVPCGSLVPGQGKIELGVLRRFEVKDLDQGYVVGAYRIGSLTYSLGLTQFGYGEYYAERVVRFCGCYHLNSLTFGVSGSLMQIDFGGRYGNLSAGSIGLGFSYRTGRLVLAGVAEDVNRPRLDEFSEKLRPSYTLYAELIGRGSYSITGKVTLQDTEKPGFGLGQRITLSSLAAVFWGVSTAPIIYGGGLEIMHKRSLITYATSYHPALGFSHTLSLGFKIGKTGSAANDKSKKRGH